jgi:murein DD-endopeptidase MepM/ murein hydrolase activator NlpD
VEKAQIVAGLGARLRGWAPEREIFVRAGGSVRFLRVTTRMQVMAASLVAMAMGASLLGMGTMLWRQQAVAVAQAAIDAQQSAVSSVAARASADKRSVDAVADDLEQRQHAMESMMKAHFGEDAAKPLDGSSVVGEQAGKPMSRPHASLDGTGRLAALHDRQQRFAQALGMAAKQRLAEVEAAIRQVGINPAQIAGGGRGGPFIPAAAFSANQGNGQLRALDNLLDRLAAMESALTVLPSGRPTNAPMETSSYGYRRDPFNGLAAFHAGIDFPGAYGQPILAASDGRVAFVGQRSGYGNCVEIDHGHGIMTRYAHLSGFAARAGQTVTRGQQIARMGSTGRSTGTHLHFEVRVNGAAVNPRPFLEAKPHVLEARQDDQALAAPGRRARDRG